MTPQPDFKGALEEFMHLEYEIAPFSSVWIDDLVTIQTLAAIKRALLIADALMGEPTPELNHSLAKELADYADKYSVNFDGLADMAAAHVLAYLKEIV